MSRLIDADALLSGFDVRKVTEYDESGCGMSYKAVPVKAIENAPTIDAEPVRHRTWKPIHASIYPYGFDVKCSECGCAILGGIGGRGYNYCPNCGAKMDLEEE